ncbi:MAG: hypothetical protein HC917_22115, partial [Richelia sp. SM2_1_7]|nr:hypothetical protein [Richelia sp. SM2_1_7]
MNINDEELKQLLDNICGGLDRESSEWRQAINRLLIQIQNSPKLLKSSHLLYLEALDETWEYVIENIHKFEPKPEIPISESLIIWVNGHLVWRIRDLYRQKAPELSLDTVTNPDSENPITLLDKLSEKGFNPPTLSGLDAYFEKKRLENIFTIWQKFEIYVLEDPEMLLRNCHPRNCPNCNCQLLTIKHLFTDPPERFTNIARKL